MQFTLQSFLVKLQYYFFSISGIRDAGTRHPDGAKRPGRRDPRQGYGAVAFHLHHQLFQML